MICSSTLLQYRLKRAGVVFGIQLEKIDEIIENQLWEQEFEVALGKDPIRGDDGNIEYLVSFRFTFNFGGFI